MRYLLALVALLFMPAYVHADVPDTVPVASPVYAGVAISDDDATSDLNIDGGPAPAAPDAAPDIAPADTMPLISVNTDSVLDLNWSGAMELSDPVLRPAPITIPFFDRYPIENIEVKLRLFNVLF